MAGEHSPSDTRYAFPRGIATNLTPLVDFTSISTVRLPAGDLPADIGRARHRLAGHVEDDVAALHAVIGGRAGGIDRGGRDVTDAAALYPQKTEECRDKS